MWETLKKILQDSGERVVIVEDGQPRYVILPIDAYLRMRAPVSTFVPSAPLAPPVRSTMDFATPAPYQRDHHGINAELSNMSYEPLDEASTAELNIEDLPF